LRGLCALALASMNYPDVLFDVAPLLFDSEKEARLHAVRALAVTEQTSAELMLRVKAMSGDADAEVTAECLASLMKLSPHKSLSFVEGYLHHVDAVVREGAALAIGESHLPQAFEVLRKCWDETVLAEMKIGLLLPMALLRSEQAFEFLVNVASEGEPKTAEAAISACRLYASDNAHLSRLGRVVKKRRLPVLTKAFSDLADRNA
jgi:HEAT repeat protein